MTKKLLSVLLVVAVLIGLPWAAHAQPGGESKPLAVFSFSGYQEVINDIDFIGSLAGQPGMGEQISLLASMMAPGTTGIDKGRPWGGVATTDGAGMQAMAFVPINDLDTIIAGFGQFAAEPEDAGDGVLSIDTDQATIYLKEKDGWAFIAQSKDALAAVPDDPISVLDGLNSKYDVAARVYFQNIPEAMRAMAIDQVKMGVQMQMQQGPEETDEQYQLRQAITKQQLDSVVTLINDLENFTLGVAIDSDEGNTFADVTLTAVPGSDTARQFAAISQKRSKFGGFLLPDALLSSHINTSLTEQDIEQAASLLKTMSAQVNEELDKDGGLDEQSRAVVKDLFARLMEVAEGTVRSGNVNAGAAVVGEGPISIAGGGFVSDGDALEAVVKKAVELVSSEPDFPQVNFDVGEHKGVRFHAATGPIPDTGDEETENARKLFGDEVTVTLGFGAQSAYVAVGPDGMSTLKQIIDASEQAADEELSAMEISLAVGPLLRLASQIDPEEAAQAGAIGAMLQEIGEDHVTLTTEVITNGVNYRLEIEQGILKALGTAGAAQAGAGAAGPQF